MQIELSAHDAAVLISRLAAQPLSAVAKAAARHEREFERVFLRAIRQAQNAIDMTALEDAVQLPGTGSTLFALQPVFDALLEDTRLTTPLETYVRAASNAHLLAAKPQVKLKDVLSATLQSGANAAELCVIDQNVGSNR